MFIRLERFFCIDGVIVKLLLILSTTTMVISGLRALREVDMKKIIAYSTLSQLSFIIIVLFLGSRVLSFFHILVHAMFKALLFFCSGIFIHEYLENQDVRNYRFGLELNVFVNGIFFVRRLSLIGFPYLSGFYSKDLVLEFIYMLNFNLFFIVLLVRLVCVTRLYSLRLIGYRVVKGKRRLKIVYGLS